MIIGVISAVVGNTIINYAVRRYRRTWFVIAILAASILLSMVLLGYLGLFRTLRSYLEVLPLFPILQHLLRVLGTPRLERALKPGSQTGT
jgi:hypothetical protein